MPHGQSMKLKKLLHKITKIYPLESSLKIQPKQRQS